MSESPLKTTFKIECLVCASKIKIGSSRNPKSFAITCPRCSSRLRVYPNDGILPLVTQIRIAEKVTPEIAVVEKQVFETRKETATAITKSNDGKLASNTPSHSSSHNRQSHLSAYHSASIMRMESLASLYLRWANDKAKQANEKNKKVRELLFEVFGQDHILVSHIDAVIERTMRSAVGGEVPSISLNTFENDVLIKFTSELQNANSQQPKKETIQNNQTSNSKSDRRVTRKNAIALPPLSDIDEQHLKYRTILEIPKETELDAIIIRRRYSILLDQLDLRKAEALGQSFHSLASQKRALVIEAATALLGRLGEAIEPKPVAVSNQGSDIRPNQLLDDFFAS